MTAIAANICEEDDSILIHCLFRKELFSLYALLKVTIAQEELIIERVSMFGFPIYASRLTSDPSSELIVVYDHE